MLYPILCYNSESVVGAWTKEKDAEVMAHHKPILDTLAAQGKLGTVARLMPTATATTVRSGREPLVVDGPFAETKQQLLGFHVIDAESLDEVVAIARSLTIETGAHEVRPILMLQPGRRFGNDTA
jgi:hypothetical protein